MAFRLLGHIVRGAWPLLLAAWALLLPAAWLLAPPWNAVAQDKEFAFLPGDAPSRVAAEVYASAFPEEMASSNLVIILHRPGNEAGHLERDLKFIEDVLEPGLRGIAEDE